MIGLSGENPTTMGVATPLAQHDQELIKAMEDSDQFQLDKIFFSKIIQNIYPETLGQVLVLSIQKGLFQRYGSVILNQKEANNISPYEDWGVGHAVIMAIHMRDLPALQYIQGAHPEFFNKIPEDGEYGIGQALLSEFMHLNYIYEQGAGDLTADFLNILISHPKAHLIEVEVPKLYGMDDIDFKKGEREIEQLSGTQNMSLYLGLLLRYAVVNGKDVDLSIAQALLNQNIAHLFEPNGAHGLGRALTNAAYYSNGFIVQKILSHQKAPLIRSSSVNISGHKTAMEKEHNLNQYGLTEAIFFSINNKAKKAETVAFELLKFIQKYNQITLYLKGDFGLENARNLAEAKKYGKIMEDIQGVIEDEIE